MSNYYQLSRDYDLAEKLLKEGQMLAVCNDKNKLFAIQLADPNLEPIGIDHLKVQNVQFLLPVGIPNTTELQHSLTSALNECDELRVDLDTAKNELTVANAVIVELTTELEIYKDANRIVEKNNEKLGTDLIDEMNTTAQLDGMIETLETQVLTLTRENEKLKEANANLRQNYINALSCDDESDQDYKEEIVSVMQRITTALGLGWHCSDYDPEDFEKRILAGISSLQTMNSIYKSDIKKLDREIEMLQETLEGAQSLHEMENRKLESNLDTWEKFAKDLNKELSSKIEILEDNLQRSESDRLSQLTGILRNIQALEETPQDKFSGALYLIKRVLYKAICRLDPSQSWE